MKKARVIFLMVLLVISAGLWYQVGVLDNEKPTVTASLIKFFGSRGATKLANLIITKVNEGISSQAHNAAARDYYKDMVKNGFSMETYNKMRNETELAGLPLTDIFQPREVKILTTPKGNQLLYNAGWKKATAEEYELYKAKAYEEYQLRRQEEDEKYDQCHVSNPIQYEWYATTGGKIIKFKPESKNHEHGNQPKLSLNNDGENYTVSVPIGQYITIGGTAFDPCKNPLAEMDRINTGVSINGVSVESSFPPVMSQYTVKRDSNGVAKIEIDEAYELKRGWRPAYDSQGFQVTWVDVPDLIDIRPILAKDGLKVDGLYIYPI